MHGKVVDHFDQLLTGPVLRVGLAGKHQHYRTILVGDDLFQPVKIGENEGGAFVGGKPPGKTDDQGVFFRRDQRAGHPFRD